MKQKRRDVDDLRARRMLSTDVQEIVFEGKPDSWRQMGGRPRHSSGSLQSIPCMRDGKYPFTVVSRKLDKGPCDVMILGPGFGLDIPPFLECVRNMLQEKAGMDRLSVDVLGLTRTIRPQVERLIRNDLSGTKEEPKAFELLEDPGLVEAYDVVLARKSVGVHTMVPSRALVKVAGMLKPEGVAFVEYDAWTDKPAKSSTGESERIVRAFNRFWDGREKVFSIDSSKSSERDKGRDLYWAVIERKR